MHVRIAAPVLLFLLIGAAWSVLVAVRVANVASQLDPVPSLDERFAESLLRDHPDLAADGPFSSTMYDSVGLTRRVLENADRDRTVVIIGTRVGWPLRCLEWSVGLRVDAEAFTVEEEYRRILNLPPERWLARNGLARIPYGVRPIGLLINAAIYGGLAALIWYIVRRVRRRSRLDRRRCPACTYDLKCTRGGNVITCPECGLAVRAALFDRPRQLLRWWMAPFALPPLVLGIAMFPGGSNWLWLRFQMRYIDPPFTWLNIVILAIMVAWLSLTALDAYQDRPLVRRLAFAFGAGALLSLSGWMSVYILIIWFTGE